MLLGYGAKNCWCFKDWIDINLRLSGYTPSEISLEKDYALITGFEGANASGKTNALKVFAFIADFAKNSFLYNPENPILFDTYFNNDDVSSFYVEFRCANNLEYRYEADLLRKCVIKETLYRVINDTNEKVIFQREKNQLTVNDLYSNENKIIFRNNASFISTLHQYGIKEIEDIFDFFSKIIINVTYTGLRYENTRDIPAVSEFYYSNKEAIDFTTALLKKFDTGITSIDISFREDEKSNKLFFPIFTHVDGTLTQKLGIENESTGTRALFINLSYYYRNLQLGGVLLLDEFDINLHPDILPHLIDLFISTERNPKAAQMIFTSCNSEILDKLSKYRSYLFEKENGESFGYRLDEPETNILRNDRLISPSYKRHLLGGFPKIDETL